MATADLKTKLLTELGRFNVLPSDYWHTATLAGFLLLEYVNSWILNTTANHFRSAYIYTYSYISIPSLVVTSNQVVVKH